MKLLREEKGVLEEFRRMEFVCLESIFLIDEVLLRVNSDFILEFLYVVDVISYDIGEFFSGLKDLEFGEMLVDLEFILILDNLEFNELCFFNILVCGKFDFIER